MLPAKQSFFALGWLWDCFCDRHQCLHHNLPISKRKKEYMPWICPKECTECQNYKHTNIDILIYWLKQPRGRWSKKLKLNYYIFLLFVSLSFAFMWGWTFAIKGDAQISRSRIIQFNLGVRLIYGQLFSCFI